MGVQVDKLEPSSGVLLEPKVSRLRKMGFLQELKGEFKQVTWTPREELAMFTKIVVSATFIFGLSTYGIDLLIKGCLTGFKTLLHLIFG